MNLYYSLLVEDPDYEQGVFAVDQPDWLLDNAEAAPLPPPKHGN